MQTYLFTLQSFFIFFSPTWGAFVFIQKPLTGDGLPYQCGLRGKPWDIIDEQQQQQNLGWSQPRKDMLKVISKTLIYFKYCMIDLRSF